VDVHLAALRDLLPLANARCLEISPLSGGITNHNYRVDVGDERYVLRIAGDGAAALGIDRTAEHACSVAAWEAGIGAEVIAFSPSRDALLTRFVAGRVLEPADFVDPSVIRRATDAIKRFHSAPPIPGSFSPFEVVRGYHSLALRHVVGLPVEMDFALQRLDEIERQVGRDAVLVPCHNDLLPANLIDDGERVRIIDWEYAGMGDPFFDLGNLAANNELDHHSEHALLRAYFGEARSDDLRRLRLMRLASDMREALWGYLQSGISTLDFDFVAYGRERLDRFLAGATAAVSQASR
jgi:thiamine kinase-like enzyme